MKTQHSHLPRDESISSKKHFGPYSGSRRPTYHGVMVIWQGLKGDDHGFESEPSVTKLNDDKTPSRRLLSHGAVFTSDDYKRASDDEYRADSSELSEVEFQSLQPSVNKRPVAKISSRRDAVFVTHLMPERCRKLINAWFHKHPKYSFTSFPCTTTGYATSLSRTWSGRKVEKSNGCISTGTSST